MNPARSTGPVLFVGGWAIAQLWLFWVAPILGAVLAGWVSRTVFDSADAPPIAGNSLAATGIRGRCGASSSAPLIFGALPFGCRQGRAVWHVDCCPCGSPTSRRMTA